MSKTRLSTGSACGGASHPPSLSPTHLPHSIPRHRANRNERTALFSNCAPDASHTTYPRKVMQRVTPVGGTRPMPSTHCSVHRPTHPPTHLLIHPGNHKQNCGAIASARRAMPARIWYDVGRLVRWVGRSFVRSIARSFDPLFARSLACLPRSLVRSLARSIACSLARLLDRPIDRSFDRPFAVGRAAGDTRAAARSRLPLREPLRKLALDHGGAQCGVPSAYAIAVPLAAICA